MPTNSAFVVSSIETISTDLLICNSGTCAGNFVSGSLDTNSAVVAGALGAGSVDTNSVACAGNISAGSLSTNSVSVAGALTCGSVNSNSGQFAVSLSVGGENVLTEAYVPPTRYYISNSPITITNMPATLNLFASGANYVQLADLGDKSEVRFLVNQTTAGASGSKIRLNYSTGFGLNPEDYSGTLSTAGLNGGVELDISAGNAVHSTGWLPLNPAAKASVYLGVVVSGGNGSADPKFGAIIAEFR
jgi:hypothetical protein